MVSVSVNVSTFGVSSTRNEFELVLPEARVIVKPKGWQNSGGATGFDNRYMSIGASKFVSKDWSDCMASCSKWFSRNVVDGVGAGLLFDRPGL